MVRKIVATLAFVFVALGVYAQVVFEVNGPRVVAVGEVFRIEFALNAKPDKLDAFAGPSIVGANVVAGPTVSQSNSISISGGSMSKSINYSYTYVLQANEKGRLVIPRASIVAEGKTYSSRDFAIEVVDQGGATSGGSGSGSDQQQIKGGQVSKANFAPDDIVVRVSVDKTTVFKGQPVIATVKLYSRAGKRIGIESYNLPAFNGFYRQDIAVDSRWGRETYNNKVYDSKLLGQYLLYPQQSGALYVEQLDLDVLAQFVVQGSPRTQMDDFFETGPQVQEVRRKISSPPVKITVRDFPSGAPAGFSGAVGRFSMTSELQSGEVRANSANAFTVKITGAGNLPLIQAPKIELPTSFEQYNIKTTESLSSGETKISGYRQFEYPFIARAQGSYDTEPIEFTYFDPEQAKYVTLKGRGEQIVVLADTSTRGSAEGGIVSGLTKEDIKILDQDIRFIKIGKSKLSTHNSLFMGSTGYFAILALLVGLFAGAYVWLRKRIREMRNTVLVRGKRANKMALKRFKAASEFMKTQNQPRFYEEMLRALWGYMGDKLNIPVANLTKDNIANKLLKRGCGTVAVSQFIELISQCEYAQYSPDASGKMTDIYGQGVELISQFESVIKK